MPKRPSKTKKTAPVPPAGGAGGNPQADQASREKFRERITRATLSKFQGRKSV
jgi:hypothetical protein